ncbi:MAG TPA: RNA polymerase factor sigma-54 [Rhizomicrobium sp.]
MALSQKLELRQGQALVMTPQLQQAIKLLQLSNLELASFVEQELERNPLLERDEAEEPALGSAAGDEAGAENAPADTELAREDFSRADDLDAEREDVFAEDAPAIPVPVQPLTDWTTVRTNGGALDDDSLERGLVRRVSLQDHLLEQLAICGFDAAGRLIGAALIDGIDESGYLRVETADIAERLGADESDVARVLAAIQGFDPTGVGARNLSECLTLQLREKKRLDPAMATLLSNLDLVAQRNLAGLCTRCEVDAEDVTDMIAEIRALTPKPGLAFGAEPVQAVVPDVFVREAADGSWLVELNTETLPRLLVNSRYYTTVVQRSRDDKDSKSYLTECLNNANWLVKSLDQRARTILKVASEIVRQQDGFLTYGVRHLRPLNLRAIAESIAMHESTVSRVTSNKYMATPRGVFELKYFFTAAIQATGGAEAHSAESVRDRIRELIRRESGEILSDNRIVDILMADGVNIARRTVAKYREAMRIPSSAERRRLGQADVGAWKSAAPLA